MKNPTIISNGYSRPIKKSRYNPGAPVLDANSIKIFRTSHALQKNLIAAFKCMLGFYGFSLDDKDKDNINIDEASSFNKRKGTWLKESNHNFLRITRILRSLSLLGLGHYAQAFLEALERLAKEESDGKVIGKVALTYWRANTVAYVSPANVRANIDEELKKYNDLFNNLKLNEESVTAKPWRKTSDAERYIRRILPAAAVTIFRDGLKAFGLEEGHADGDRLQCFLHTIWQWRNGRDRSLDADAEQALRRDFGVQEMWNMVDINNFQLTTIANKIGAIIHCYAIDTTSGMLVNTANVGNAFITQRHYHLLNYGNHFEPLWPVDVADQKEDITQSKTKDNQSSKKDKDGGDASGKGNDKGRPSPDKDDDLDETVIYEEEPKGTGNQSQSVQSSGSNVKEKSHKPQDKDSGAEVGHDAPKKKSGGPDERALAIMDEEEEKQEKTKIKVKPKKKPKKRSKLKLPEDNEGKVRHLIENGQAGSGGFQLVTHALSLGQIEKATDLSLRELSIIKFCGDSGKLIRGVKYKILQVPRKYELPANYVILMKEQQ